MKSCLGYPGGKYFAKKKILKYIEGEREICSPFIGGGSMEVELASNGKRVYGYDAFPQLVNFWHNLLNNKDELYEIVERYYEQFKNPSPDDNLRDIYYQLRQECIDGDLTLENAAKFFVVNRLSFSKLTLIGGFSTLQKISEGVMKRMKDFHLPNLTVECMSFEESIERHRDIMLLCDPPYIIDSVLYGTGKKRDNLHNGFNHQLLRDILCNREKWVLCYNNCNEVRALYSDFRMIDPIWTYHMSKDSKSKELLIFSPDIEVEELKNPITFNILEHESGFVEIEQLAA